MRAFVVRSSVARPDSLHDFRSKIRWLSSSAEWSALIRKLSVRISYRQATSTTPLLRDQMATQQMKRRMNKAPQIHGRALDLKIPARIPSCPQILVTRTILKRVENGLANAGLFLHRSYKITVQIRTYIALGEV